MPLNKKNTLGGKGYDFSDSQWNTSFRPVVEFFDPFSFNSLLGFLPIEVLLGGPEVDLDLYLTKALDLNWRVCRTNKRMLSELEISTQGSFATFPLGSGFFLSPGRGGSRRDPPRGVGEGIQNR